MSTGTHAVDGDDERVGVEGSFGAAGAGWVGGTWDEGIVSGRGRGQVEG